MASSASLHGIQKLTSESLTPEVRRAVELELDAICNDTQFRASQRNCAFLRYVITETLAGRADEIKERTLGKELFGRPISYDTGSDAVVRVRANEVRKRLIYYYENHESQAGWRVHLPLRTYVPVFLPESTFHQAQPIVTPPQPKVQEQAEVTAFPETATFIPMQPVQMNPVQTQPDQVLHEQDFPGEVPAIPLGAVLPFSRMIIPTLVALFLCAATFRWQAFSGTPYLDFWEALLAGHAGMALVLDADPADPHAVTTSDLEIVKPLLETAALFHASTEIGSSAAEAQRNDLLAVHITHYSPQAIMDDAAYVTLIPGRDTQLWIGSKNGQALDLAIHSVSNTDLFPVALEVAGRRKTPTRLRFADKEQVTMETLPAGDATWKF